MFTVKKIDHVAVCVKDIDLALAKYKEVLGVTPTVRETVASQKTEAVLLPIGDSNVELISPRGNDGLEKFLEKRGPGLHHIAVDVEGIEKALELLKALGVPLSWLFAGWLGYGIAAYAFNIHGWHRTPMDMLLFGVLTVVAGLIAAMRRLVTPYETPA